MTEVIVVTCLESESEYKLQLVCTEFEFINKWNTKNVVYKFNVKKTIACTGMQNLGLRSARSALH